jgi:hypothetical protein
MFLFLVRHFNDIDHITPVAWKMKSDNFQVGVYCMNPRYDVWNDYRLCFLKNQGVAVDYLHNAFDRHRGQFHQILNRLVQTSYGVQQRFNAQDRKQSLIWAGLGGRLAGFAGSLFYKLTRRLFYNTRWARSILEQTGARAICFDYVMPSLYVVDAFLKAAKEMSIPSLALPHGVYLYTNEGAKPKATDTRRFAKFNRFDHIIIPNQLRKEILVGSGVAEEKMVVLGSARYCSEWLEQHKKIVPRVLESKHQEPQKLKVVLMASKPQARMDVDRMADTLDMLAELDEIDVLIKPHTRAAGSQNLFDDMQLPNASHVLTAELCEWADVLLVVGSSVVTEALMRGKAALYLRYLHSNTTLFEALGACWIIHDEIELKNALLSLQANRTDVPYKKESVAEFLSEVVYGGGSPRDILHEYEQFIAGCASN